MLKKRKIVSCKVVEIKENFIVVKYKNKLFNCPSNQISDFKVDLFEFFQLDKYYKFYFIDPKHISYKFIRPKLIKNKRHPIPTASGATNLEAHLKKLISMQKQKDCENQDN
ncbi:MAG: hypothetical protein HUJ42_01550 [Malacoplasma sp.]|nr:hypothetical protein [Malacoplasma sp.]